MKKTEIYRQHGLTDYVESNARYFDSFWTEEVEDGVVRSSSGKEEAAEPASRSQLSQPECLLPLVCMASAASAASAGGAVGIRGNVF